MKFKMAATAGLSLTMDPMRKMFQNASLNPLGQLKPNCPGMIIGRSSTKFCFYADQKSKVATTAGHRLTLDPMGKCSNAFSETTNMIKAKLYMNALKSKHGQQKSTLKQQQPYTLTPEQQPYTFTPEQ